MKAACLCLMLVLATSTVHGTDAPDPRELAKQLKALETEINKFKAELKSTEGERSALERTLSDTEKQISELLKKVDQIQQQMTRGEARVSALRADQAQLEVGKREQQQMIAKQVRAAYEIGNQEYLKMVLNQEDPNRIARMMTYYDYFNRARAKQVTAFRETINALEATKRDITRQQLDLAQSRLSMDQEKATLDTVQADRATTLVALTAEIARTGTEIENRLRDRERLEALLAKISERVAALPTPTDSMPFGDRKGKLILPVEGTIANRFGSTRNGGKLKWDGIFIEAASGAPINAVHYGRVVFSDWLRGFGLLLIINHGDGFMSLYGHNQVLYRETGDWVTAGEVIATVGNSGGQDRSGLYFEIRQAGTPTDPQIWCQARRDRTA
jgi:murein hydrolase activator